MSDNTSGRNAGKAAIVVSSGAAIAAAAAWLSSRKAAAKENGEVTIPAELMELIIAIAQSVDNVDQDMDTLISALTGQDVNIQVQGYVSNTETITANIVQCPVANTAVQLPYIPVPDDMQLFIKAIGPFGPNPGWIRIAGSAGECVNATQSFPLLPNETVGYRVKNAEALFISATVANCFVAITVEQRKNGG